MATAPTLSIQLVNFSAAEQPDWEPLLAQARGADRAGIDRLIARGEEPAPFDIEIPLISLPAVLGVEYGIGFGCTTMRGSENNDIFTSNNGGRGQITTTSNRHGGMLGGITSGLPIILRAAVKPTSSLPIEQPTVTREGEATTIQTRGRHDPCLLPRFVPMAEAMVAIVLADHWLRWKSQCG